MKHIVSFSGGKDSTAMLLMMIDKQMPIDRIVCIDTTKEFPQMYGHIHKVSEMISPLKIEVYKIDFDYYFSQHIKTKGNNKGDMGYGWPSSRTRWCTALKRELFNKVVKGTEVTRYLGIAADETVRLSRDKRDRIIRYPLAEWGVTEAQALQYCYDKGLDWGGLYDKLHRVSCWCCPLKRQQEYLMIRRHYPDVWKDIIEMDRLQKRKFKTSYSLDELSIKLDKLEHTL